MKLERISSELSQSLKNSSSLEKQSSGIEPGSQIQAKKDEAPLLFGPGTQGAKLKDAEEEKKSEDQGTAE